MIKQLLTLCLVAVTFSAKAQVPKNEIGIDITGLSKLLIGSTSLSENQYYLTYRHYFNEVNLKMGVGFDYFREENDQNSNPAVDNSRLIIRRTLNYRVGIEKMTTLNKKFQLFYGAYYTQYSHHYYDNRLFVIQNFAVGRKEQTLQVGIAPFLGLRYNFTPLIGIETSSFFNFYYKTKTSRDFQRFIGPTIGTIPEDSFSNLSIWQIDDKPPFFLMLTLKI